MYAKVDSTARGGCGIVIPYGFRLLAARQDGSNSNSSKLLFLECIFSSKVGNHIRENFGKIKR
ncbi:MAG: hypothetical protein RLY14_1017 [Planctomycetota bacterium]|jgi:hypothetical protein